MKTVRDFICVMIIFALLSGLCVCLAANDADDLGYDEALISTIVPQLASDNEPLSSNVSTIYDVPVSLGLSAAA